SSIRDFERKFLTTHRYLFEKDVENIIPEEIMIQFVHLLSSQNDSLQSLGSLLKKIIFILIFTVWDLRNWTAPNRATELRNIESMTIGLGFGFLVPIVENINLAWDSGNESNSTVLECLPAVSIWCQYLGTLMDLLSQLYSYSKSIEKENERIAGIFLTNMRNFFKSFVSILNNSKTCDLLGANYDLAELAKHSILEDMEFLGSFDILHYDDSVGQFTLIDEESKKKERQQRMMKLMAQQRLKDEIDTMENKLQKFGVSSRPNHIPLPENAVSKPKISQKQCVVDISVILNHLNSVKNWVADEKCTVIVPLDVIDSLDLIKKGNNQEN
ncbi:36937_t:CDS:2, partial [Racocetra persica]